MKLVRTAGNVKPLCYASCFSQTQESREIASVINNQICCSPVGHSDGQLYLNFMGMEIPLLFEK